MKKIVNFIISNISLQLISCNESFFTLFQKKGDKK